jgi:hypothetical protein
MFKANFKFKVLRNKELSGTKEEPLRCSFCDRSSDDAGKLFANSDQLTVRACICHECISTLNSVVESEKLNPPT